MRGDRHNRATAALVLFTADAALFSKRLGGDTRRGEAIGAAMRLRLAEVVAGCSAPAEIVLASDRATHPKLRHRMEAACGSGHVHEIRQKGVCFGARLLASARAAASLGCERLVLVGDDTPSLTSDDLDRALMSQDVVLGPSKDGGFYLLGINTSDLHLLQDVPWQTEGVFDAIVSAAARTGTSVNTLSERADIDSAADANAAAHEIGAAIARLSPRLMRLGHIDGTRPPRASPPISNPLISVNAPRGPPSA